MTTTPALGADPLPIQRPDTRRSIGVEIAVVFAITLGSSALNSIVDIVEDLIRAAQTKTNLAQYQVTVAAPRSDYSTIDLLRQVLSVVQQTAWGLLGLYLLWKAGVNLSQRLGLNAKRVGWDLRAAVVLAAVIGIPGLGLYLIAQHLGVNLTVAASTLNDYWWRLPVTVLIAVENGFLEEALVIGYLITRLEQLRWRRWAIIGASATLRGSYHLYQGFGGFLGNAIMGTVFGWFFTRWRRLWPLIITHSLIDTVAFVGYPLLKGHVSWLP